MGEDAGAKQERLLDVGVWGPGPTSYAAFVAANRKREHKARELSGMKWLYAHAYYKEAEFWDIHHRRWYEVLRAKYDATSLPSVYNTVKVDVDGDGERGAAVEASWGGWLEGVAA